MSNNGKFSKQGGAGQPKSRLVLILSCVAAALVLLLIVMLIFLPEQEDTPTEPTTEATESQETTQATTEATEETETTEETTDATDPTEPQMLEHLAELYAENPDIFGWIKIEGTKLDDPVMFTPDDEDKYLRANFEGHYSTAGLPIMDARCSADPESPILIIHGHNMLDGTKFRNIMNYCEKEYWEEHPVIQFSTLYEEREYEVLAAFYDKVYKKSDDVFKFYQFVDPQSEEEFNEGIAYFKEHSEYDTGVTAEYGDRLITLVTCSYHETNGRFVVVAREITEDTE